MQFALKLHIHLVETSSAANNLYQDFKQQTLRRDSDQFEKMPNMSSSKTKATRLTICFTLWFYYQPDVFKEVLFYVHISQSKRKTLSISLMLCPWDIGIALNCLEFFASVHRRYHLIGWGKMQAMKFSCEGLKFPGTCLFFSESLHHLHIGLRFYGKLDHVCHLFSCKVCHIDFLWGQKGIWEAGPK